MGSLKILITGGFGYLGGRFSQFLGSQTSHEIILGSRRPTQSPSWLPQAKVVSTLWNSPSELERICAGIDVVVHLAGMNAQDCAADPETALEFNAGATARLLQAAIQQRVKRFLYLSTAHVYGSPLAGKITEKTPSTPSHPYATSHRIGEEVVQAAHQGGKIEGIVIRLSNAYGAPAHKDALCWMLLVNNLCRQAVATQRLELRSSGMERRDFITLTDACRAFRHLLELPADKLGDGLFNVGGSWSPTILEMTQRVAARIEVATGNRLPIRRQEDSKEGISEPLSYEIQKLIDTGFHLESPIDKEIDDLIRFCLEPKNFS